MAEKNEDAVEQVEEPAAGATEESLEGDDASDSRGGKGKYLLMALLGAGGAFALKKKRDQEFDEALWEDPQAF